MNQLLSVERWIEQIVEEPFVRLFAGHLLPHDVARHLLRALEDGERIGADGRLEVPGRYRIELSATDLGALRRHHPNLDEQLTLALTQIVDHMELRTHQTPAVTLAVNPDLAPRTVHISPADLAGSPPEHTRELHVAAVRQAAAMGATFSVPERGPQAYLIVEGDRTFDLETSQITLGRALDNDLILEDKQVSRHHARLRHRYGRYILEDLGSTGGTSVNGYPVQEIVLRPGDLISLSGVELIYAEDGSAGRPEKSGSVNLAPRKGTQPIARASE